MDKNSLRVTKSARFEEETQEILGSDKARVLKLLEWALPRNPFFGQQVVGSDHWVWVIYIAGYAYLVYYSVSDQEITLQSLIKRKTPIAPRPLGLES